MSKNENNQIAQQIIEDFLSNGKQIQIVVAIDDFDRETISDNEDDLEHYLHFYLHNKAGTEDLDDVYNISRKYNYINDGTAYVFVDTAGKLSGKQKLTSSFDNNEKHLYCEYPFLLNAVKQNSQVKLVVNNKQIQLQKS